LDRLVLLEIEQHAAALGQLLAVHQAKRALSAVGRKLDRKGVHAGSRYDFDGVLPASSRHRHGCGESPANDD
jgi:hypothetical protein